MDNPSAPSCRIAALDTTAVSTRLAAIEERLDEIIKRLDELHSNLSAMLDTRTATYADMQHGDR